MSSENAVFSNHFGVALNGSDCLIEFGIQFPGKEAKTQVVVGMSAVGLAVLSKTLAAVIEKHETSTEQKLISEEKIDEIMSNINHQQATRK